MPEHGSHVNATYANAIVIKDGKPLIPEKGMGATELHWTDRDAYDIIGVVYSKTEWDGQGNRLVDAVVVQECEYKLVGKDHTDQRYEYARNPDGVVKVVTRRKNGQWVTMGEGLKHGTKWILGRREKYRDPHF